MPWSRVTYVRRPTAVVPAGIAYFHGFRTVQHGGGVPHHKGQLRLLCLQRSTNRLRHTTWPNRQRRSKSCLWGHGCLLPGARPTRAPHECPGHGSLSFFLKNAPMALELSKQATRQAERSPPKGWITRSSPEHHYNITTTSMQHHYNMTTKSPEHHYNITTTSLQHHYNMTTK